MGFRVKTGHRGWSREPPLCPQQEEERLDAGERSQKSISSNHIRTGMQSGHKWKCRRFWKHTHRWYPYPRPPEAKKEGSTIHRILRDFVRTSPNFQRTHCRGEGAGERHALRMFQNALRTHTAAGCTFSELRVLCWGTVGSLPSGSGQSNCFGCRASLRAASAPHCSSEELHREGVAGPCSLSEQVGQGVS